ncbi:hypothetical protein BKA70DRAFT_1437044 [Coprinopsis sp. MPI-PUGE-AT-0042]|nr:hypothetical protein BKA70DRAFT_1437044 [Coprinopsis sp. MPI-PUGE-AT-0042]
MSQLGGGVLTRSSVKKASRPPEESKPSPSARLQCSLARLQRGDAGSASARLPALAQPRFTGQDEAAETPLSAPAVDDDDSFGQTISSPLTRMSSGITSHAPEKRLDTVGYAKAFDSASLSSSALSTKQSQPKLSSLGHQHIAPHSCAPSTPGSTNRPLDQIPEDGELPSLHPPFAPPPIGSPPLPHHPLLAALHPFMNTHFPENFDILAAQAPADDEEDGSRCEVSIDGEDEDFDASPSHQRAGRIPNSHKSVIDQGNREIDEIFLRMHRETGRTVENLQNHYLASKGFKRVTPNLWNQYQRYFKKFRVQERIACGNPNAQCNEAFNHFRSRHVNWRQVITEIDEILTQQAACVSGYRRRTSFNQFNQKLEALARTNHQTHGFELFAVIMGNQPNTDQNIFSIVESEGAQGFMGEEGEDGACMWAVSRSFATSERTSSSNLANKAHVATFRSQHDTNAFAPPPMSTGPERLKRKEKPTEDKQIQPVKRSASVVSATSDLKNDITLIRDFFHSQLGAVGISISHNALPWAKLVDRVGAHGGVILDYPEDVPFPAISDDPTYTGTACKSDGRKEEFGVRSIGTQAVRRLAQRCHSGEGGIRFIGGVSTANIKGSVIPWIVGPVSTRDISGIRCLFFNGQARRLPLSSLPVEWFPESQHELSPSTPKPSKHKPMSMSESPAAPKRLPHTSKARGEPTSPRSPPAPVRSFPPVPPFLPIPKDHGSPKARFCGTHSRSAVTTPGPSSPSHGKMSTPVRSESHGYCGSVFPTHQDSPLSSNSSTPGPKAIPSSKRVLDDHDVGSPSPHSKRLKGASPDPPPMKPNSKTPSLQSTSTNLSSDILTVSSLVKPALTQCQPPLASSDVAPHISPFSMQEEFSLGDFSSQDGRGDVRGGQGSLDVSRALCDHRFSSTPSATPAATPAAPITPAPPATFPPPPPPATSPPPAPSTTSPPVAPPSTPPVPAVPVAPATLPAPPAPFSNSHEASFSPNDATGQAMPPAAAYPGSFAPAPWTGVTKTQLVDLACLAFSLPKFVPTPGLRAKLRGKPAGVA